MGVCAIEFCYTNFAIVTCTLCSVNSSCNINTTYISFTFDSSVVCICMFENILNRANGTFEYNQRCVVVVALVASCVVVDEYCKYTPMIKCATKCKIVAAIHFTNIHPHHTTHTFIFTDSQKKIAQQPCRQSKNILALCCIQQCNSDILLEFSTSSSQFHRADYYTLQYFALYCTVFYIEYIVVLIVIFFITLRKCPIVTYNRTNTHTQHDNKIANSVTVSRSENSISIFTSLAIYHLSNALNLCSYRHWY